MVEWKVQFAFYRGRSCLGTFWFFGKLLLFRTFRFHLKIAFLLHFRLSVRPASRANFRIFSSKIRQFSVKTRQINDFIDNISLHIRNAASKMDSPSGFRQRKCRWRFVFTSVVNRLVSLSYPSFSFTFTVLAYIFYSSQACLSVVCSQKRVLITVLDCVKSTPHTRRNTKMLLLVYFCFFRSYWRSTHSLIIFCVR